MNGQLSFFSSAWIQSSVNFCKTELNESSYNPFSTHRNHLATNQNTLHSNTLTSIYEILIAMDYFFFFYPFIYINSVSWIKWTSELITFSVFTWFNQVFHLCYDVLKCVTFYNYCTNIGKVLFWVWYKLSSIVRTCSVNYFKADVAVRVRGRSHRTRFCISIVFQC